MNPTPQKSTFVYSLPTPFRFPCQKAIFVGLLIFNRNITLILVAVLAITSSCNLFRHKDTSKGKPLARVKDVYLYDSDVKDLVKNAHSPKDSLEVIKNFVDSWVKKQLMLDKAQTYLSSEQQDLEQQLKDYKESLLIFRYESELTRQKLDTIVKDGEVEEYFSKNKDNFELRDQLMQFLFVKIRKDAPKIDTARVLIRSSKEADRKKLASYCIQYASDYLLKDTIWYELNNIYRQMPIKQEALESLAKNKMSGEVEDSSYIYLLKVNNFRGRTELAPLDFVKDDIRRIIINKRKIDLISKTYDNLYKDGLQKGDLEKY